MRLVEDNISLEDLCRELCGQEYITIDTEFVREKTYFPKLCLIQVAFKDGAAIIDPLSKGLDLAPFFDVLTNSNVLKVFHAGKQDIEIFYQLSKKIPTPVFDTQIAASVCGFGRCVSYDNLVESITKTELDKSSRLTDWSVRPLEEKQLQYALRDVTFLIPCYEFLKDYLQKHNRTSWIIEETEELLDERCYQIDPENAWQKIKHSAHSGLFLAALKELAAWRERRAMRYNVPKRTIAKDELLVALASSLPKNLAELKLVRNIRSDFVKGKFAAEILEVLDRAKKMPMTGELKKIDREKKVHCPPSASALVEVLKLLLKIKCEQNGVVENVVASEQEIRDLACGNDKDNLILKGWRYELFGKDALAFRKGLATLSYDTTQKKIVVSVSKKNTRVSNSEA